ncbi:hypothetical protein VUR80DRAFT_6819 [Thermomyces stellatus]
MDVKAEFPAYPRITIEYCTQCKWMLRAAYYAQELLSTFESSIAEVCLRPAKSGTFKIHITSKPADHPPPHATSSPPLSGSQSVSAKAPFAADGEEDEEGPPLFPRESRQSASTRRPSGPPPHTDNAEVHASSPPPPISQTPLESVSAKDPFGSSEAPLFPPNSPTAPNATRQRRRTSAIARMENPELKEVLNHVVTKTLWDRRQDGGFPETKELKRRVRDVIDPGRSLGHVDRDAKTGSHEGGACGKPCKECD